MNRQSLLAVIASLVIASAISAKAAEPAASSNTDNEFAGKIVAVHMANNAMYKLENAKVINCGGESYLAGTGMERKELKRQEWWHGLPIRLNLRFVDSYFPMTPEQWKALNDEYPSAPTGTK